MSSEFEPTEGTQDPTPGDNGGADGQAQQGTQAPQTPAARTYSDADMAAARRSFEVQSRREREAALAAVRAEYEQRFAPKPTTDDPWSQFDPTVAAAFRKVLEHEFGTRLAPLQTIQTQQEDIAFRNDEAEIRSKYPDYAKNRVAVLEYGVQNGIVNLEQAYRAWKYDELSSLDPKKIGQDAIANYTKRKTAQASGTPAVEGRGGGAPSSKQNFKSREEMDEAVIEMVKAANESSA